MKRYDTYKDSGIEWIGEIPENWEIKRLKFISKIIPSNVDKKTKEGEKKVLLCNYVDVYKNDLITSEIDFMKASASDAQIEKLTLKADDVILTKDSEDPSDIGVPTFVKESFDNVVCGYHLTLLRTSKELLNGNFLYWFIRSNGCSQNFFTQARGITRYALGSNAFKNLKLSIPSIDEQIKISIYLNNKTQQIDSLIAKKAKLITLLEEERIAIINQAVTKGLDLTVPMKDSEIDWLGEIPKHWKLTRLKRVITEIFLGLTSKVDYVENKNDGVPLIRAGNLFGGKLDLSDLKYISLEQHKKLTKYRKVQKGDVLVTKSGSIGVCAILDTDGEFSLYESVFSIRPDFQKLTSYYLLLLLNSHFLKQQYKSEMVGMGVHHLNMGDMKNTVIALPNIEEQKDILAKVNIRTLEIETIITKVHKEIEHLKEYKTTLIGEVVTGKVDVRNEVL